MSTNTFLVLISLIMGDCLVIFRTITTFMKDLCCIEKSSSIFSHVKNVISLPIHVGLLLVHMTLLLIHVALLFSCNIITYPCHISYSCQIDIHISHSQIILLEFFKFCHIDDIPVRIITSRYISMPY